MSHTNHLIQFPDYQRLQTEVEKLRIELSMLVLERDELLYVECKNLEMAYMLALGGQEFRAYQLQCTILRLKRKIELIQAFINRQENISIPTIEEVLDNEFAAYKEQLDSQIDRMNAALERSKGEFLTTEEAAELKTLYRKAVKALHPDLHPDQSEGRLTMFYHAVASYENGDLSSLRIICEMVAQEDSQNNDSSILHLAKQKERLTAIIADIHTHIKTIKSEYPYTMKNLLQNEEELQKKKEELNTIIVQLEEVLSLYESRITEMLR